jgi:rfaE bifunctional protein kinase chain/domain
VRNLLQHIEDVPVLVVGDVVVDRYVFGTTTRISREAPVPVVLHEHEDIRPGGAANAAVNVAALGARPTLLGVVGQDAAARSLRHVLKGGGVLLSLVAEKGRPTAQKTRILAGAQGTRAQQVLRLDHDPRGAPSESSLASLVRLVRASKARAVLLSDYGGGLMEGPVMAALAARARDGLPVLVDSRWALARALGPVVLKPNAPELAELTGLPVTTAQQVAEAATRAMKKLGAAAVVATRGRDGMVVVQRGRKAVVIPAHGSGEVTDVTGAGDTVAAALVAGLASGMDLVEAARLANVAASIVVQKLGAATATPDEILHALENP